MTSAAPTILALETDSAWVVILAVSIVTLPAALLCRRVLRRPGGIASGLLVSTPLLLPIVAALAFRHPVLPEVGVLRPVGSVLAKEDLLRWFFLSDGRGQVAPYAFSGSAGRWLLFFGAVASSVMLVRRLVGTLLVHRLIRRCRPISELSEGARIRAGVARLAASTRLRRAPEVLALPAGVPGAFVVGGRGGRILLSRELVQELDPLELEAIIAHEIAHLEARDVQTVFVAGLLRDMVAWNPIAHVSYRHLIEDRELEADRRAATMTGEPLALASGLIKVCELLGRRGRFRHRAALAILKPRRRITRRVSDLIALADGVTLVSPRPSGRVPFVAAACLVAVLGLQAGARIAHDESPGIAIVWGAPSTSETTRWNSADVELPHLKGANARKLKAGDAKAGERSLAGRAAPTHSLRYLEQNAFAVRVRDLPNFIHYVQRVARRQGISMRVLRGESQLNLHAEPILPLQSAVGIYRIEPSNLTGLFKRS